MEPLYKDTPEMSTSYYMQDTVIGPTYIDMCTQMTPQMRTPPLIRTLQAVPRVSAIEGFHCMYKICIFSVINSCCMGSGKYTSNAGMSFFCVPTEPNLSIILCNCTHHTSMLYVKSIYSCLCVQYVFVI